jgi:hypothetical protein
MLDRSGHLIARSRTQLAMIGMSMSMWMIFTTIRATILATIPAAAICRRSDAGSAG